MTLESNSAGFPPPREIVVSVSEDIRGAFESPWVFDDFQRMGIQFQPNNACYSYNAMAHTLRAFHYQDVPFAQSKLVSCVSGRIWDVAVDLRPGSPRYLKWSAVELVAASGKSHFIPGGFAHGFLTLTDDSTVAYLIEGPYRPDAARVLRWDDPEIGVPWPTSSPILSDKDRNAPLWASLRSLP